jgi:hypothetical protein
MQDNNFKQIPNEGNHRCFACNPMNTSGLQMKLLADEEETLCARTTGKFALASGRVAKRMGILDDDLLAAFAPLLE